MTDIDTWRAQEREALTNVIGQMEQLVSLPATERTGVIEALRHELAAGIHVTGDCVSIRLATDWIELDLAEENASFHADRFKRWRREIGFKKAKPGLETDCLVIQIHLKRLHGDRLTAELRNPIPESLPIRWLDCVQIDRVSLELMIRDAWKVDESLYLPEDADLDKKIAFAEELIVKARHLSQFSGLSLEGNTILVNRTFEGVTFNYRWVTIEKDVPEVVAAGLVGKSLGSAVGTRSNAFAAVTITKASRHEANGKHKLTLETDRLDQRRMIALKPSRQLETEKEPSA